MARRSTSLLLWNVLLLLAFGIAADDAAAQGGSCQGGANHLEACVQDADCDSVCIGGNAMEGCTLDADCGPACSAGASFGTPCVDDGDCADTCVGGAFPGDACVDDSDCWGECSVLSFMCSGATLTLCDFLGLCVGGEFAGTLCAGAAYCPGGVCDTSGTTCDNVPSCTQVGLCEAGTCESAFCAPNGANVCFIDSISEYRDISVVLAGSAQDTASPSEVFSLSGSSATVVVPADLVVQAYNASLISSGVVNVPADLDVEILGSNSSEGTQLRSASTTAMTTVTDPDGNRNTGDESATPVNIMVPLADTSWTAPPVTQSVVFAQGNVVATVSLGILDVELDCHPGLADIPPTTFTQVDPTPFEITTVTAPATAPSAIGDTATVNALGMVEIDVLANDFDVNLDIDPSTLEITLPPTEGLVDVNAFTGIVTYVSTTADRGQDQFLYKVRDETGLSSSVASVGVTIVAPLPVPGLPLVSLPILVLGLGAGGAAILRRRRRAR